MKKFVFPLVAMSAFTSAMLMGCSENENQEVAGGISEETNSVAGVLMDRNGKAVQGVTVMARHTAVDTLTFSDTTSENGEFSFPLVRQGVYGISATVDSLAYYSTVNYEGADISLEAKLRKVSSVSANVVLSEDTDFDGIEVFVAGSNWRATTDSTGYFELSKLPVGKYALQVNSPDPGRYLNTQYAMNLSEDGFSLAGPMPTDFNLESSDSSNIFTAASQKSTEITLPLSIEYGLLSWMPMDYTAVIDGDTVTTDARGRMGSTKLYGGAELTAGVVNKALRFNGANQFGVIEDDRSVLDSLTEMTLEAFVKINELGEKNKDGYQKNILGKLGFGAEDDRNVFTLALINGVCEAKEPTLAFFLADEENKFSCDNAVISSAGLVEKDWIHVVVTWSNGSAKIYQNSELTGSRDVSVKMLQPSDEPIFLGKEDLDLELDDVRLGAKAITSADVLYRYYQKTGGKL